MKVLDYRPLGVVWLVVLCGGESLVCIFFGFVRGIAWFAGVPIFAMIAYGLWQLDNRARWAFAITLLFPGPFIFVHGDLSLTLIVVSLISAIICLALPKVRMAFRNGLSVRPIQRRMSAVFQSAMRKDQSGSEVSYEQAKRFFVSRMMEEATAQRRVEVYREIALMRLPFGGKSRPPRLSWSRASKLSALLETALVNDLRDSVSRSEAIAVYRRRRQALTESWFNELRYLGDRDVGLEGIVDGALRRNRAFWSTVDWIVAISSIVVCLLFVGLTVGLAIYLSLYGLQ